MSNATKDSSFRAKRNRSWSSNESDEETKENIMADVKSSAEEYTSPEDFVQNFVKACSEILSFEYNFDSNNLNLLASICKLKDFLKFHQSKIVSNIEKIYWKLARWIVVFSDNIEKLDCNKVKEYYEILTILREENEYKEWILIKNISIDISFLEIPSKEKFSYIDKEIIKSSPYPNTLLTIWDKLDTDISDYLKNRVKIEKSESKNEQESK